MRRVMGVLVEQLRWWRSGKGELASAKATAALGSEATAVAGEEGGREKQMACAAEHGRVLAVM